MNLTTRFWCFILLLVLLFLLPLCTCCLLVFECWLCLFDSGLWRVLVWFGCFVIPVLIAVWVCLVLLVIVGGN